MEMEKDITLLISSKTTRIYLNILSKYLQEAIPGAEITYFVSQHDSENMVTRQTAVVESINLKDKTGILISMDGNVPVKILKNFAGPKILIYLSEVGVPHNKRKYIQGYDYFVPFGKELEKDFLAICKSQNVKIVSGIKNIFAKVMREKENIIYAKLEICKKYPQLQGKKIVSIITRGKCKRQYLKQYEKLNLRKMLKTLPDDTVLATNCNEIYRHSSGLPFKYTEKLLIFSQNDIISMIIASDWIISNMAITENSIAIQYPLLYSDNEYEQESIKRRKGVCVTPEKIVSCVFRDTSVGEEKEENSASQDQFVELIAGLLDV